MKFDIMAQVSDKYDRLMFHSRATNQNVNSAFAVQQLARRVEHARQYMSDTPDKGEGVKRG